MMRKRARTWILLASMALTIGCDRVTKHAATVSLAGESRRSYFGDTVRIEYAENRGAFLGLGDGLPEWARTGVFTIGTGVLLAALAAAVFKFRVGGRALVGLNLVLAGGASNLADRIAFGRVVDFMNIGIGSVRTGIFNVADVVIIVGVALLASARRGPS